MPARHFIRTSSTYEQYPHSSVYNFSTSSSFTFFMKIRPTKDTQANVGLIMHKWGTAPSAGYPWRIAWSLAAGPLGMNWARYNGSSSDVSNTVVWPFGVDRWGAVMWGRNNADSTFFLGYGDPESGKFGHINPVSKSLTGTFTSTDTVRFAWWPFAATHFTGDLADVVICDTALSQEFGDHYLRGGTLPNEVARWDENTGLDRTPNANHRTALSGTHITEEAAPPTARFYWRPVGSPSMYHRLMLMGVGS